MNRLLVLMVALFAGVLLSGTGLSLADNFLGRSADQWQNDLGSADDTTRTNAAFALGKIGSEADLALPALVRLLQEDKNAGVREAAALAIGRIVRRGGSGDAIKALCAALASDVDYTVKRSAAVALGQIAVDTPEVRGTLEKALDDQPADGRGKGLKQNVAWALGEVCEKAGKPPVTSLRKALRDSDKLVKRDAAIAIGKLAAKDAAQAAVPDLVACVGHDYLELRKAACFSLVELVGPNDDAARRALAKVCGNPKEDVEILCNAALALGNIGGPEAKAAVPILRDMLKGNSLDLKKRAALGFRHMGETAKQALPELLNALKHEDAGLRYNVAVALGGLKFPEAVPALVERIVDDKEKEQVRAAACMALQTTGLCDQAIAAVNALVGVLDNPKQPVLVRERILWSLRVHNTDLLKYDTVLNAMTKLLTEPGLKTRQSSTGQNSGKMLWYDTAFLLGVLMGPEAPEAVMPVLQEFMGDDHVRIFLGLKVASTGTGKERPMSDKSTVNESGDSDGRIMALKALGRIGKDRVMVNVAIMNQLRKMRAGPPFEPEIQQEAAAILTQWGQGK
jgi:HEAT repeat protein